ncbi:MAG: hypothetical protein GWP08_15245 [Nitrospiraceae bacterium]|nr:hypothetical protein [Nitrospiraceae bacterium]
MDPITAINSVGAAIKAARSFVDVLKAGGTKPQNPPQRLIFVSEPKAFGTALHKAITRFVESRDKDGDGKLTQAELGASNKLFARLDANEDGKVDALELLQAAHRSRNATAASADTATTT